MTFEILRLGYKGEGIADGPVFVPGALPGEVVTGQREGNRLLDVKIVTPVPDRIAPPCPHYKRCGGCNLQHASDAFVAAWKTERVVSALSAHGLPAPIRDLHVSPPGTRRRATFSARRTKNGAEVGFHAARDQTIVPVPECRILTERVLRSREAIADIATLLASRKSAIRVAVTETTTGLDLSASGGKAVDRPLGEGLVSVGERFDLARLVVDDDVVFTRRAPLVVFDGVSVPVPPAAFLQATEDGERALSCAVKDALTDAKGPIADLFSGCGTFAIPLAKRASVHAVESHAPALAALEAGWRHGSGLRMVSTERRDLFRRPLMPDELARFGGVVLDPPRAGAAAQVAQIATSTVPYLAMVSCDPITFARDAALLVAAGYRMNWIDVVDQFCWSHHVELVASLEKRAL